MLIAEDSRIQAKMLEKRLVDAGHTVRWAINGQKAVELLNFLAVPSAEVGRSYHNKMPFLEGCWATRSR